MVFNGTYNTILLLRDGQAPVFLSDYESVKKWGVLQYCEKVSDENANLQSMASALLKTYNTKGRNLSAKKALGDIRVRGGTLLPVILSLGDINVSSYLMVEQVKHSFGDNEHFMDLKLRGGSFVT